MVPKTCSVPECENGGYLTRGLCKMHYARLRRHGSPGTAAKQHSVSWAGVACQIDECDSPVASVGYCTAHYKRLLRYGDPLGTPRVLTEAERFWSKVDKRGPEECWNWVAGKTAGYGGFHPSKEVTELAHRWSYREANGEIDPDLVLDHLCRNRACVNPAHLEPVSNIENLRRGAGYALENGMRTTCINGHEYTIENTYVNPNKKNDVRCRRCASIRSSQRDSNRARKLRRLNLINERQAA